MSKRIEINEEQLEAIKKLVECLEVEEYEHYQEWINSDYLSHKPEDHIYYSVSIVRNMLNKIKTI